MFNIFVRASADLFERSTQVVYIGHIYLRTYSAANELGQREFSFVHLN